MVFLTISLNVSNLLTKDQGGYIVFGIHTTRKLVTGFFAGTFDHTTSYITGKRISVAKHLIDKLKKCDPWSDHIVESAAKGITIALAEGDYKAARILLALGSSESADKTCLELLKAAIDICALNDEIIYDLIPFYDK